MDKIGYRAIIKYVFLKGLKATQIHNDFTEKLRDSTTSLMTVSRCVNEFKRGRDSLEDNPRSGRPQTSTSSNIVEKVHKLLFENRRLRLQQIAEEVGISKERVH
jgi:transposase